MPFKTKLTRLLSVDHPIVLAPMGGVSGAALAKAVSTAGGLGLIGASYGNREWMTAELAGMESFQKPWGIGLVMFTVIKQMELLHLALSYRPHVVALSFGDPAPFIGPIKDAGAKVAVQVHDLDQARTALSCGVDLLIVQGCEAGGHSAGRSSFPLIPAVRDSVGESIPIIAAGGVGDGRGLSAALALGADGVMMGTRFAVTSESLFSGKVKAHLVAAQAKHTVRTRAFDIVRGIDWPLGYSGRVIANKFSDAWIGREAELQTCRDEVGVVYQRAVEQDDLDFRAVWAGEIVDLIHDVRPASQVVKETIAEAEKASLAVSKFIITE
jgi:nitronate monooxygenase